MIFASNNKGKISEIKEIFNTEEILSLKDVNINLDIKENGKTYYENALIKAKTIYELTKIPTIADDSGLEIMALNNYPGVNTHRICEDDTKRNLLLIDKTKDLLDKRIQAVCVLVYYDGTNIIKARGTLKGTITDQIYEGNGFGFDKIFRLKNGKMVSELTMEEKNKISARSMAAKHLKEKLKNIER